MTEKQREYVKRTQFRIPIVDRNYIPASSTTQHTSESNMQTYLTYFVFSINLTSLIVPELPLELLKSLLQQLLSLE